MPLSLQTAFLSETTGDPAQLCQADEEDGFSKPPRTQKAAGLKGKQRKVRLSMAKLTPAKARAVLRLYVGGNAPNALLAIANLKTISETHFPEHEVEIVDVFKYSQRALADGIIVTPTLLKLAPAPIQRVMGNLSDTAQVLLTLANQ